MFPKQLHVKNRSACLMNKQQGFLLPLAFFILIVMSMFALVLSRSTIQTSNMGTLEIVTLQAFYAGESGAYRGMKTLFFPSSSSRNGIDTRCAALNSTYTYTTNGLKNCSAVVTCTCLYADNTACAAGTAANYLPSASAGVSISFYTVSSVATCGTGNLRAVRTVESSAMMKQE